MNRIRRKLFIQLGSIILFFILLIYLSNTFLLEPFYLFKAKRLILKISDHINSLDVDEYTHNNLYDLSISGPSFFEISIFDKDHELIYSQTPNKPPIDNFIENTVHPSPPTKEQMAITKTETLNENSKFIFFEDRLRKMSVIAYITKLSNENELTIMIPMAPLEQNIHTLNLYLFFIGFITLLLTLGLANILARHFTKPILDMHNVTTKMRHMDFSTKCKKTTNDEIGMLCDNINMMQETLSKNIAELKKQAELRKQLVSNVSHELKTPIALIRGYSEGLHKKINTDMDRALFYCDVIMDESEKMDMLLGQLLDINRVESGDFNLDKEKYDAHSYIYHILNKFEPIAKNEKATFNIDIENIKDRYYIFIDAFRTEQVLSNLIRNALTYVDDNKIIEIKTSITKDKKHIRVTVSNTTDELDKESLSKLFHTFYKADSARTREKGGYGLGLSIIKAIQTADNNDFGVYQNNKVIYFYVDLDIADED